MHGDELFVTKVVIHVSGVCRGCAWESVICYEDCSTCT